MPMERSKVTPQSNQIIETHFLVAKENNLILDKRPVKLFNLLVGEWRSEVYAADLRCNCGEIGVTVTDS